MIKTLIAFTAIISLATFTQAHSDVRSEMLEPLVKINDNCSAISLRINNDTFLLTAAHCTAENKEGYVVDEVRSIDQVVLRQGHVLFDTVRFDAEKDLALLKVRDPLYIPQTVTLAEKLLVDEGDKVYVVGYPLAVTRTITEGLFNGLQTEKFNNLKVTTKYRASPNIDGGNSGGALFQKNGEVYELIGVTSMKYNVNNFMGLFVTLKDIRTFLRLDTSLVKTTKIDLR